MRTTSSCSTCRSRKKRCKSTISGRACEFCISKGFRCDQPGSSKSNGSQDVLENLASQSVLSTTVGACATSNIVASALGDQSLCDELIDVYFRTLHFSQQILFHRQAFLHKYQCGGIPEYIILGVMALAARFSSNPLFDSIDLSSRGKPFLKQAMRCFNDREKLISVEALQGCLLLQFCAFVEGDAELDAILTASALRMAHALRLPTTLNTNKLEQEIENHVYWQTFMVDCWNSVRAQIPRQLRSDPGFLKPLQENLFEKMPVTGSATFLEGAEESRDISIWGRILSLTEFHAQTVSLNYDITHDPAFHFRTRNLVRDLAAKLDQWLRSLPIFLHNTPENLARYKQRGFGRAFAVMHITYHQTCQSLFYSFLRGHTDSPSDNEAATYTELCKSHATSLSKFMWLLHTTPDLDCLWSPGNGHFLVIASTIHLHTMLLATDGPIVEEAKAQLQQNFVILQTLGAFWPVVGTAFSRLNAFHQACRDSSILNILDMDEWMGKFLIEFDLLIEPRNIYKNQG